VSVAHLAIAAPHWVGDLVMATPVLHAALECGRFERVTIGVRAHLAELLAGGALEAHVRAHRGGASEVALWRELAPDALLLLSNSFGSAWRAFQAGVRLRAGTDLAGRGLLLTHAVRPPTLGGRRFPIPTAHLQRDAAGLVGVLTGDLHPRLSSPQAERAEARAHLEALGLAPGEDYVYCAPGAAFGAAKLWPPERFAAVLDQLRERHGWRGVVGGGPGEEALMRAVAGASRRGALHLADAPRTLRGLKALVALARLVLVGDSGPRWVAAAFDVPCVTILGPNIPQLTASSLERCEVVRLDGLDCSPCAERTCPLGHHRCMRDLSVEAVLAGVERVLARCGARGELACA
jgi:heptosyltransferase-2